HAHRLAFNEGRSFTGPGLLDGAPRGQIDGGQVVAVYNLTRHAVGLGAIDHILDGHLQTQRRGVGVLVVVTEEDDRELADRREVHRLVEVASAGAAVAGVGDDHAGLAAQPERQRYPGGDRQVVGQV